MSFASPDLVSQPAGLYFFGGSADLSSQNHANDQLPLEVIGSPEMINLGVRVDGASGFSTGIPGSGDMTAICVVKALVPASAPAGQLIFNNFNPTAPSNGQSMGFGRRTGLPGLVGYAPSASGSAQEVVGLRTDQSVILDDWSMYAMRWKPTGEMKIWWRQRGQKIEQQESAPAQRLYSARPMLIGAVDNAGPNFKAPLDLSCLAVFTEALSDEEVSANMEALAISYEALAGVSL